MLTLYARNEFKGVLITCPHCHMAARHDPDDIGDAIKEHKPVECVLCAKSFNVFVEVAPIEAAQQGVQSDFACTCGKCEPLEGNEEFCKFTRRPIPQSR